MPTYYVSQSIGSNANNGTSPSTPWSTLAFALGAASGTNPGLVGGDIVYVAPGSYNESVTVGMTSATSTVQIIGDPNNAQGFPNVSGGIIFWWHLTSLVLTATSKNNLSFSNIYFERALVNNAVSITCTTCYSWTFNKCVIISGLIATSVSPNALNWTITRTVFLIGGGITALNFTTGSGSTYNTNLIINDCLFVPAIGSGATSCMGITSGVGNGGTVSNCTFLHGNVCAQMGSSNTTNKLMFQNCLFLGASSFFINPAGQIDAQYNRYVVALGFNGVSGTGSTTGGLNGLDLGNARNFGYGLNDFFGSNAGAANIGFGTTSGAPASDLYGVTWLTTPDAGAVQRSVLTNFQPPTAPYVAAERNASTITIAPGSTSQSIEMYLGSTGLTASTAGLSAYFNRTRTASVAITLVARTIAQAWTSGGFAEVDSTNMPGVYRLDIPDAALIAGADDVTIVVRGASGTNGAVMTVTLIEEPTDAVLVRMGPFEVKADGLGASDPLDIQKGAQHGVDIQCVDAFGSGIDITSATVTAKVYNSGATLVDTYSCTATYAADGRATFTIDTTVTNTPGTYTATITRTTGASDTQIFGPLRIYVRDI